MFNIIIRILQVLILNRSMNFETFFVAFRIVRNSSGKLKAIKLLRYSLTKVVKDWTSCWKFKLDLLRVETDRYFIIFCITCQTIWEIGWASFQQVLFKQNNVSKQQIFWMMLGCNWNFIEQYFIFCLHKSKFFTLRLNVIHTNDLTFKSRTRLTWLLTAFSCSIWKRLDSNPRPFDRETSSHRALTYPS